MLRQLFVPPSSRRIVTSAGIGDRVRNEVVQQVRVVEVAVEGKLQNPGAGNLKLVGQCVYVRSDKTEIFRDEKAGRRAPCTPLQEAGARS